MESFFTNLILYIIPIIFFIICKLVEYINKKIYKMKDEHDINTKRLELIFLLIAFVPLINFFWILHGTPYIIKNIFHYIRIIFIKFKKGINYE